MLRNTIQVRKFRGTDWIASNRHLTEFARSMQYVVIAFPGLCWTFIFGVLEQASLSAISYYNTSNFLFKSTYVLFFFNLWLNRIYKIFQFLVQRGYLFVFVHHINIVFSSYFLCIFLLLFRLHQRFSYCCAIQCFMARLLKLWRTG